MVAPSHIRLIAVITALTVLASCGTQTAGTGEIPTEENRDYAVMTLDPGDVIRYALDESSQRIEGVVQQVEPDGLHVHSGGETVFLETDSISRLWVRRRSFWKGVLWGAVPGFVVVTGLTVFGLGIHDESVLLAPVLGCVGALVTGSVGGVVGAVTPRWELLFQAD